MTGNAIEAVSLSKRFVVATERRTSLKERFVRGRAPAPRKFWALKDATFSVPKGSSLGLIGPNGSGKSTALKVLTGIYRPTSGHVKVNGSVSALLEVGAGFHPELTGRENIRLNATILGFSNREIDRLMDSIIEFADIGEHIEVPIKHYSSGMYVRLGFSVAVMVRPEVLLVDEVIAVGDEEFQRKCYDYLYDLRRSGTSMIIVSHGLGQITDLCDQAVWLEHGEVRGIGSSRSITRAYLDDVNAREAERSSVAPALSTAEPTRPRRGTGQARVKSFDLLDATGEAVATAQTGDTMRLRVTFEAREALEGMILSLAVENAEGIPMLGVDSWALGPVHVPAGKGYADFVASPLLLSPGVYEVKPTMTVESSIIDTLDEGFPLVVRSSEAHHPGPYLQPGTWEWSMEGTPQGAP